MNRKKAIIPMAGYISLTIFSNPTTLSTEAQKSTKTTQKALLLMYFSAKFTDSKPQESKVLAVATSKTIVPMHSKTGPFSLQISTIGSSDFLPGKTIIAESSSAKITAIKKQAIVAANSFFVQLFPSGKTIGNAQNAFMQAYVGQSHKRLLTFFVVIIFIAQWLLQSERMQIATKNKIKIGSKKAFAFAIPPSPQKSKIPIPQKVTKNRAGKFWQSKRIPAIILAVRQKQQTAKNHSKTIENFPKQIVPSSFVFFAFEEIASKIIPKRNAKSGSTKSKEAQPAKPKNVQISWPLAKPAPIIAPTIVMAAEKHPILPLLSILKQMKKQLQILHICFKKTKD